MQNIKIEETENFTLISPDTSASYAQIFIKYPDRQELVASVQSIAFSESECPTRCILTYGTAFQDCIVSWELFKEFVYLIDKAYDFLSETNTDRK